jgi:uracil-DNA glycosylase
VRPLLVGESNPYGASPEFALYPLPEHASGARLARILGLSRTQYLRAFDRVNLLQCSKWSARLAREAASLLDATRPSEQVFVLLGARVCSAFGGTGESLCEVRTGCGRTAVLLPHPSGRNRVWNEPGTVERARALVEGLLA